MRCNLCENSYESKPLIVDGNPYSECPFCGLVQAPDFMEPNFPARNEESKKSRLKLIERVFKAARIKASNILEIGSNYLEGATGCDHINDLVPAQADSLNFDAFLCFNHIEYYASGSSDIRDWLGVLYNCLAPDAFGLVTATNYLAAWRKKDKSVFIPGRNFYFTPETLLKAFEISGFKGTAYEELGNEFAITVVKRVDQLSKFEEKENEPKK